MSEKAIKVTDRRMFTPDGKLREEYEHILTPSTEPAAEVPVPSLVEPPAPAMTKIVDERAPQMPEATATAPAEAPGGGPSFMDLIGMLAEPASIHLGEAHQALSRGAAAEGRRSLEMARLHIDLLALLEQKTQGNLSLPERSLLDDVLSQLRLGYVETNR